MSLVSAITTFLPARPDVEVEALGPKVQIFVLPGSQLRRLPKSSGFVAFSDSTGWLAHGSMLAIKDKADYKLDDQIRSLAPIAQGAAVSVPAKSIPGKRLVVANVYNDRKVATRDSFAAAFDAAVEEIKKNGGDSAIFADPTPGWNYQEHRVDPDFAAELFVEAIVRNRKKLKAFRIVLTDPNSFDAYKKLFSDLNENAWRYYESSVA
ncbi:MAG: hypothetical protein U0R49_09640 [Fimbriimonadales bacterium]